MNSREKVLKKQTLGHQQLCTETKPRTQLQHINTMDHQQAMNCSNCLIMCYVSMQAAGKVGEQGLSKV
jgi:hypothetical protein